MKYLSMFSGIGTAEKGIEQAYDALRQIQQINGNNGFQRPAESHRSRSKPIAIGFAEIDKYASAIYRYHWPEVRNYGDATAIVCDELDDFEFLVAGFPCQSFSIAGKRQGFNEARGTLFFEIARILSHKRPRHFLLENVKGLLSSDDGKVYTTILRILADLDYRVETVVLNSKYYGVPQNRERVFFIGHLRDECCGEILSFGDGDGEFDEVQREAGSEWERLSVATESRERHQSGVESGRDGRERHGDTSVTVGTLRTHKDGQGFREMQSNVAPSLNARAREDGSGQGVVAVASRGLPRDGVNEQQLEPRFDGCTNSLTSVEKDNLVMTSMADRRIRRLTEIECERLQGLPDDFTKYGIIDGKTVEISSTQRYKTLGNAMTVNVIEAIVTRMLDKGCLE